MYLLEEDERVLEWTNEKTPLVPLVNLPHPFWLDAVRLT